MAVSPAPVGAPRRHRDPAVVAAKHARLHEPHVAPLAAFVDRLRAQTGHGRAIPHFDPDEGGVHARVLILAEAPGPRAVGGADGPRPAVAGSGFVSPENDSATSANYWTFAQEAGLDRRRVATWNVVPWYVGDETRIRAVTTADLDEARPHTLALLPLLPHVRVVVLYGRKAAQGWRAMGAPLPSVETPHPSPTNVNARPAARPAIVAGLREARRIAGI